MEGTQALCTLHKTSYFVLTSHPASTDNCPYGDEEASQGPDHERRKHIRPLERQETRDTGVPEYSHRSFEADSYGWQGWVSAMAPLSLAWGTPRTRGMGAL